MPYARRACEVCGSLFSPPHRGRGTKEYTLHRCVQCRGLTEAAESRSTAEWRPLDVPVPAPPTHLAAPMRQAVFDLETWGLDRGWGVTLVGAILVHGAADGPVWHEFDLTQSKCWPEVRSDDSELVHKILQVLRQCDILYAHNGERFDIRWLRTVALKYGYDFSEKKLVDPCAVAWRRYKLGSNSLGALADFLGLSEQKMPVSVETWRKALMDNDPLSWATLRERCRSDVRVLNEVAAKVTRDVGMVDFRGSAYGR